MNTSSPIIVIKDLKIRLGGAWIHKGLNLEIIKGEVLGIVGSSGSGKTTLIREILMLQPPNSGSIKVLDQELTQANTETLLAIQKKWGVLFQQNALFSSLTVLENVMFPLKEKANIDSATMHKLALQKILAVGLPKEAAYKYPAELSGGMQKRAALARAIVLDPDILFLDEPSAGLDPDSASELDELILNLQYTLGLTIIIVTHDLDTLWNVTDRVAYLHQGKVLCVEPMEEMIKNSNESVQKFFNGPRGRAAKEAQNK